MPVLSVVSFGSIYLQGNAIYLQPWGSVYEAFALANFFMLINAFISPDHSSEAAFFDKVKLKNGKTAGASWFTVRSTNDNPSGNAKETYRDLVVWCSNTHRSL